VLAAVLVIALGVRLAPLWLSGLAGFLLLVALTWSRYTARGVRRELSIPRSRVIGVEAHTGIPLLSRPRFVVRYRSEGGVKHRHLVCPSRIWGFEAFEAGVGLFEHRGLLETAADDA
jgi:hypothetical protein